MTSERIKEIQQQTAYSDSISVQQALLQVWNECEQLSQQEISDEEIEKAARDYYQSPFGNMDREIGFRYAIKWYREQLKQL